MTIGSMNKVCPKCKQVKLLTDFYACAPNKDGRQAYYKPCWDIYVNKYKQKWMVGRKRVTIDGKRKWVKV